MNAQMKRGILELCVLAMLHKKDCYGFELVSMVSETVHMSEGTVYPLLKRIKDDPTLCEILVHKSGLFQHSSISADQWN